MIKLILICLTAFSLFISSTVLLPVSVSAAVPKACDNSGGFLGFPTWYKYLDVVEGSAGNCDIVVPKKLPPNDTQTDLGALLGPVLLAIFEIILRISGILAVIFVIWGGIQYQLSQGEPERLGKARSVIINALIGMAITVSATAIVNLVARNLI